MTVRSALCGALALTLAAAGCDATEEGMSQSPSNVASTAVPQGKQVIRPEGYRPTPSPLSPGILVGNTLYLSGSTGGNPSTGQLVPGGFEAEMHQVLANMTTVLAAAEMDLTDVVQVTTYLADMSDYARYNEIYREYFTEEPLPTRATVAVKELARGARIEMMMIAAR
jgi:2-iminobutanoate/2-iminopropanoate deaminase